jgi:hypothetical protein
MGAAVEQLNRPAKIIAEALDRRLKQPTGDESQIQLDKARLIEARDHVRHEGRNDKNSFQTDPPPCSTVSEHRLIKH